MVLIIEISLQFLQFIPRANILPEDKYNNKIFPMWQLWFSIFEMYAMCLW